MKLNFLIIFFFLPVTFAYGQNNFMALSFGGSYPLKDFASYTDLTHHGFALNGFTGDYSGAFFSKKNFGIGGNIRYTSNSIDENALLDLLVSEFPDDFPLTDEPSYISGFWNHISLLIGPEYTIPTERVNIDLFVHSGITFILPPEMGVEAVNGDNYYNRKLEIRTVNLGLNIGCALRYHLSAFTSIRIHLSYFISASKGDIIKNMDIEGNTTSDREDYFCPINTFNVGIGIAYRLYSIAE